MLSIPLSIFLFIQKKKKKKEKRKNNFCGGGFRPLEIEKNKSCTSLPERN